MLPRSQVRTLAVLCSGLTALSVNAKPLPAGCGTDQYSRRAEDRYLYGRSQMARLAATGSAFSLAPSPAAADGIADVTPGIAFVDDSDGVRTRRNAFSLSGKRLDFSYTGAAGYRFTAADGGYDESAAANGTRLEGLDDDDTRVVDLPFEFPFYGNRYSRMFVNSDGNVSFEQGDNASSDRSLSRMAAGPPRISALFSDLNPLDSSQGVRVLPAANRVVVSWVGVPFYGTARAQSFQIELRDDGGIALAFGSTQVTLDDVVTGISPGRLLGETKIVPLTAGGGEELFAGGVAEVFSSRETYDIPRALQRFYATHEDSYDLVFVFNALNMLPSLCPTAIACTDVVRNSVTGYGRTVLDDGPIFGSRKRLETVIDMGPVENYPANPYQEHPQRPGTGDTGLNIFGHEASHRFLAWVSPRDASGSQFLLGRQGAHWNFNFNSEGSLVEGNRIQDLGEGANPRFLSLGAGERIAPFDQYFFGWRDAATIPPSFVVLNSTVANTSTPPRPGTRFHGTRLDVSINDLIDTVGPRYPDHEIAPRRFRWAILVIGAAGQTLPAAIVDKLERYRQALPEFWGFASEGNSSVDMEFRRELSISFAPYADLPARSAVTATISIREPQAEPLTLALEGFGGPHVTVPDAVTIPAGATTVSFEMLTLDPGYQFLTVRPSDARWETVETRIRVNQ